MEEIRKQTVSRIAEFFNGESTNAEVDTYKKLLDFEKEVKKQLTLTDVSQQRELLKAYTKWLDDKLRDEEELNELIDNYFDSL